ncbi:MAG TPA: D-2-hydroxyacid dehydrogenase [Candidatus Margulisiibacteriota bacterium]|nr:D-2-hydroxyacid dehydrogenase [Candidatus Margulisiibacteriota bacterium]
MARLTIVALNASSQDAAFDAVRSIDPGNIDVVHAPFRTDWANVSARRRSGAVIEQDLPDDLRAALARADVVFSFLVPSHLPQLAPRLRWLHTPATGIDHLRGTGVFESDIMVTTVGGLFAPVIAEHVLALMLHFAKRLHIFEPQQRERVWQMSRVQSLANRTVGLVGVGNIGAQVARLAQAFGMRVVGIGRSAPQGRVIAGVDQLLARTELPALLTQSDYVVVAVADTPETRHLIGAPELAALQPQAVLINVARGTVIDEAALIAALQAKRIAGAGLDVFAREPLPADSPLWLLPQVVLTPHVAANVEGYLAKAIAQFAENVRRFARGMPLENQFDRLRGY